MKRGLQRAEEIFPGDFIVELDEQTMTEILILLVSVSRTREVTFLLSGDDRLHEAVAVRRDYDVLSRVNKISS